MATAAEKFVLKSADIRRTLKIAVKHVYKGFARRQRVANTRWSGASGPRNCDRV
jgi:hypothetical protein